MRSAAPAIRYLLRVVIFTGSLALFFGWLAAPEVLRAGREAAAGYVPLPVETASPVGSPNVASHPTPEGGATALALAALLVLTFGFGVPRDPRDRGSAAGSRMFEGPVRRVREAFTVVPVRAAVPVPGRRRSASLVFVLALGLFLGWMSAPDFVRHHEVSVAALRTAADGEGRSTGRGDSSQLMDGFSSWIGPTSAGQAVESYGGMPLTLLEAVPQTTDLLELEVFEDAETLLAEIEEAEPAQAELLYDETRVASAPASRREPAGENPRAERAARDRGDEPADLADPEGRIFAASSGPAGASTAGPTGGDTSGTGATDGGSAPPTRTASSGNGSGAGDDPGQPGNGGGDNSTDDGGRGLAGLVDIQPVLGEIFVRFEDAAAGTAIADLLQAIGGEISQCFAVIDDCVVKVSSALDPRQLAKDLSGQPTVAAATPNWVRLPATTPGDTLFPLQWSLQDRLLGRDIGAVGAWRAMGGVSRTVEVAVLDTVVDHQHPDLIDVIGKIEALSEKGLGSLPDHGTNVAGIFAAQGDLVGISGVNRSWAKVHIFEVIRTLTIGSTIGDFVQVVGAKDSDIVAAIDKLTQQYRGVRVANMSFAGGPPSNALCGAIAGAGDVLFVAAAGNGGSASSSVYPANCPGENVIAVASLDRTGHLAPTSNRGSWVEIAAPGDLILTTAPGASYVLNSGTSMAAPHVAGVASMIFAKHPGYSPGTVRDLLMNRSGAGKLGIGGGRLDACKALGGSGC